MAVHNPDHDHQSPNGVKSFLNFSPNSILLGAQDALVGVGPDPGGCRCVHDPDQHDHQSLLRRSMGSDTF